MLAGWFEIKEFIYSIENTCQHKIVCNQKDQKEKAADSREPEWPLN